MNIWWSRIRLRAVSERARARRIILSKALFDHLTLVLSLVER